MYTIRDKSFGASRLRSRLVAAQAVSLVMGLVGSVPASAEQSLGQVIRSGSYYEQNAFNACTNSNFCDVVFSKVPGGTILTLQRANCSVKSNEPLQTLTMAVHRSPQDFFARPHPLQAALISAHNGTQHYAGLTQTEFPVSSASPRIRAFTSSPVSTNQIVIECQIAGRTSP